MQRIKLNVFKSWFDKNLTGKEIDFLLVLSFYQDKRGVTRGVYYKDMMREGKMSAQTFYDCKKSLTEKGVISSVEGQDDYDITLIGNDFTIYGKEDYEEGKVKYLSTTYHLFRDPYFRTLKPKQKSAKFKGKRVLYKSNKFKYIYKFIYLSNSYIFF